MGLILPSQQRPTLPTGPWKAPTPPQMGPPSAGPPVFKPAPRRNHATAGQLPAGGLVGYQAGVDANPGNDAYEQFLDQIAAEHRGRVGRNLGGRLGGSLMPGPVR